MIHLERSALLPHSPEQLLALVQDVARYPEFVPGCIGAVVEKAGLESSRASLQFKLAGLTESFLTENTLRNEADAGQVLEMRLLCGPFKSLAGQWSIQPLGTAGSKVTLSVSLDLGAWSLGRLLVPQMERTVVAVMQAFKQRAAVLYV